MREKAASMSRSEMMSRIGSKDTAPELLIRRALHAKGFRYKLHDKRLPGRPDLVLPKYRAVIFVHGCFWHAHDGCANFRLPMTRRDFWEKKLTRNRERDEGVISKLMADGWRILIVWECETRIAPPTDLILKIDNWLRSNRRWAEIPKSTAAARATGSNSGEMKK